MPRFVQWGCTVSSHIGRLGSPILGSWTRAESPKTNVASMVREPQPPRGNPNSLAPLGYLVPATCNQVLQVQLGSKSLVQDNINISMCTQQHKPSYNKFVSGAFQWNAKNIVQLCIYNIHKSNFGVSLGIKLVATTSLHWRCRNFVGVVMAAVFATTSAPFNLRTPQGPPLPKREEREYSTCVGCGSRSPLLFSPQNLLFSQRLVL
jgi:hypothetical protein